MFVLEEVTEVVQKHFYCFGTHIHVVLIFKTCSLFIYIHISNENYAIDNQLAHHLEVDFEGGVDFRLPKACRVFNQKIPNSLQLLHVGVKFFEFFVR